MARDMTTAPLKSPDMDGERTIDLSPRTFYVGLGVMLACLAGAFFYFLTSQVEYAIDSPDDWGHTLLVPAIVGWLVYRDRGRLQEMQPFKPAWSGIFLVVFGLAFYLTAMPGIGPKWLMIHHNARAVGIGITLVGVVLTLFGWRPMRWLWFPIAYLVVFGTTYTDGILNVITERLQDISARGGFLLLVLMGVDVDISGNAITLFPDGSDANGAPLPPIPLNVAEACSGMRMLVAFMALGTLMAYVGLKFWWQRILLIGLGVPVAVIVNVLRVATLGVLSLWDPGFSSGQFHTFIGFVWLVPAFMCFLGLMNLVSRLVIEVPDESKKSVAQAPGSGS